MKGICTLANDRVYDQLIALLNSIAAIYGDQMPVCIYPYDDNISQITAAISSRKNVEIYQDQTSIATWDNFARNIWDIYDQIVPQNDQINPQSENRFGTHRRFCAFDNPFDKFVYMDADTLLMSNIDHLFDRLNSLDWIVYDFQYKDLSHVYNQSIPKLHQLFSPNRLKTEIFCSGFYATKKNIFPQIDRDKILQCLNQGEAEILYKKAPDQTILNYLVMKLGLKFSNLALDLPPNKITGCCVTSRHFQEKEHILYDHNNALTYLHYIGIPSTVFSRLCAGENINFPYREIFLYYRYLQEPEKRPKLTGKSQNYQVYPNFLQKLSRKIKAVLMLK